ncbi:MAG: hypothetical protein NC132_01490 [Corallococcus sp.]|nr:hypothetical protein [Corallococcus sp.]MCM1359331.1 hypothetical protein [Corallococcus sp.]MCM1394774.1 hypothetical protein [Corallococcus sp.]
MNAKELEQLIDKESSRPRIGKVVFYGVCEFCNRKIDVSSKLEFNRKIELVNAFGIEKIGNEWVCKHEIPLQNCPFCQYLPF